MNSLVVNLSKNLRRNILQGNPWVYQNAIKPVGKISQPQLCKLNDSKGAPLGWGIYSPQNPIAVRVLSLDKAAPKQEAINKKLEKAWALRESMRREDNNCYRLINGEGDLLPGVICDVYDKVGVLQFDGPEMVLFWEGFNLSEWLLENTNLKTVYFKPRHNMNIKPKTWGAELSEATEVLENGAKFLVDIINGQKTGFFLDQRDNRDYVRSISSNKSVANLFSYSGGFSIYAGLGGASKVTSVDISSGALELADKSWALNKLNSEKHNAESADVFEWLKATSQKSDIVICDPPSLAKSEKHKDQAVKKYIEAFSLAARSVKENGHLVISSCSSHINFNDFKEIAHQALSKARLRGQVLKTSGQGADHPYPHACEHFRYLKFMDIVVYK